VKVELASGAPFRFRAGTHDRWTIHEVFVRDAYGLSGIAPGSLDTVIDVGGHIGSFTVRAAPLARRVFTFEPSPENLALLESNADPAFYPHVRVFPAAVARRPGPLLMRLSGGNAGSNTLADLPPIASAEAGTVRVDAIALVDFIRDERIERISLLKLDCEGAEYEILESLAEAGALDRVDRIALEYHEAVPPEPEDRSGLGIERRLAAAGFAVVRRPGRTARENRRRTGLITARRG
jgi:FkbM family methyltransferase